MLSRSINHFFLQNTLLSLRSLTTSASILYKSPQSFIRYLNQNNIKRGYIVYDEKNNSFKTSHPALESVTNDVKNLPDFHQHEGMFFQLSPSKFTFGSKKENALFGVFLHHTQRGQGAGGCRLWHYNTVGDFINDGMRLAEGMGRKSSLAGLWWGGGKGVVCSPFASTLLYSERKRLFQEMGSFISSLQGIYVSAEDVGLHTIDCNNIFSKTRFMTCINEKYGGSGNPSILTAHGVVSGVESACDYLNLSLKDQRIAVQGAGNVAQPLIIKLLSLGCAPENIIVSDIDKKVLKVVQNINNNIKTLMVARDDNSIVTSDTDILIPCALGGILNPDTIPFIKAKIICGAANNQLKDPYSDDILLNERNILYVPDFVANRMGIVNCVNEQYGSLTNDPLIQRNFDKNWEYSVYTITQNVLRKSKAEGITPNKSAFIISDELMKEKHPLMGHRCSNIIQDLINSHWEQQ